MLVLRIEKGGFLDTVCKIAELAALNEGEGVGLWRCNICKGKYEKAQNFNCVLKEEGGYFCLRVCLVYRRKVRVNPSQNPCQRYCDGN